MFLSEPNTPEAKAFLDKELASNGFVMNLEHAWAWRPDVAEAFMALRKQLTDGSALQPREVALMVCATARARGDSYCALAWGPRLAALAGADFAAAILRGEAPAGISGRERVLQRWTQLVVRDPNSVTAAEIGELRAAGFSEREILEATVFVGLRLAFSTINDALGAPPDGQLAAAAPEAVRLAVDYGRAPASISRASSS